MTKYGLFGWVLFYFWKKKNCPSLWFQKFHVLVPFVWHALPMAWHVQLWGTRSPLALKGQEWCFGGGFESKVRKKAELSFGSPECKKKNLNKSELSKVYFFNWKCKFIHIFRSWNVVVTYWVGGNFCMLWTWSSSFCGFILLCTCVCLNKVTCLAYKHIECALLPMGYVVCILQKN